MLSLALVTTKECIHPAPQSLNRVYFSEALSLP